MSTMMAVPSFRGVPFAPNGQEASIPLPPKAKSKGEGTSAFSPARILPIKISILAPKARNSPMEPFLRIRFSISYWNSRSVIPGRKHSGISAYVLAWRSAEMRNISISYGVFIRRSSRIIAVAFPVSFGLKIFCRRI